MSTVAKLKDVKYVYKILLPSEWEKLKENGTFSGSMLDLNDGYIHLSMNTQVNKTLNKYFQDIEQVIILQIDYSKIENNIKWESSSNGEIFPHLYQLNIEYSFICDSTQVSPLGEPKKYLP
ncbi:MAG: DUF952 domain-containing protein [Oligoflexales bacterium]